MTNPRFGYVMVAGAVLLCSWTLFGQDRSQMQIGATGRYVVTASASTVIMVDSVSGKSWSYADSAATGTSPVWIPIERLDDRDAVDKWARQVQEKSGGNRRTYHEGAPSR